MDHGEVLQGLEEEWKFAGATGMEWISGVVVFLMIGSMGYSTVQSMPFMLIGLVSTAFALASIRQLYPDEHRGVRNAITTACGIDPFDIPPPASLQPVWSGTPLRSLPSDSRFVKLGFDEVFPSFQDEFRDPEDMRV